MTEANNFRAPRRRHNGVVSDEGPSQNDQAQGQPQKKGGKQTRSIKYVKIEKERPSLTRDQAKKQEPQKSKRKRGSSVKRESAGVDLKIIPLVFAGWLRYVMGIDDKGEPFTPSDEPLLADRGALVRRLPARAQDAIRGALEKGGPMDEGEMRRAMNGRLCDIEGRLPGVMTESGGGLFEISAKAAPPAAASQGCADPQAQERQARSRSAQARAANRAKPGPARA